MNLGEAARACKLKGSLRVVLCICMMILFIPALALPYSFSNISHLFQIENATYQPQSKWNTSFRLAGTTNNPYKIDDALYAIYERASKARMNIEALRIADTLYNEAERVKARKAQCLAMSIPLYYYSKRNNYRALYIAGEKLRKFSQKYNYWQYYYFAYSQEIIFLLNHSLSLRAIRLTEEMRNFAFENNHPFGIYTCFVSSGNIFMMRGSYRRALYEYEQALQYAKDSLPDQSLSSIYRRMSEAYSSCGDYVQAVNMVKKAIECGKTEENRVLSNRELCSLYYDMNDKENFDKQFQKCESEFSKYGLSSFNSERLLKFRKAVMDEKFDDALVLLNDSSVTSLTRYSMLSSLYERKKDYKNALYNFRKLKQMNDSIMGILQASDMLEFSVLVGSEQYKRQAKELELNNAMLKLKQLDTQALYEKSESEKKKLELTNKELELSQLKSETEKRELAIKEWRTKSHMKLILLFSALVVLLVILLFLMFYTHRRRITMRRMTQKNKELEVAREQAEQADRMKTFFIQNMSHEIRTPLNSIVGFSQVLAANDMALDEEQRSEFGRLIQHNSDLLTTLINDILDLANLESGKYVMKLAPCRCNELCSDSVATVKYRMPDGVKLYFTSEVDDDFELNTDANRVKQVLINYLVNASKYTEQGEVHLHCSLSETPGKITFSVTDTGVGIPAEKADKVFERFEKLDSFKQGSGLGLNICRIIAERLNGEVKIDKSYTDGARFLLILPLK